MVGLVAKTGADFAYGDQESKETLLVNRFLEKAKGANTNMSSFFTAN